MTARWTWSPAWRRLFLGVPRPGRHDRRCAGAGRGIDVAGALGEEQRVERTLKTVPPLCLWRP